MDSNQSASDDKTGKEKAVKDDAPAKNKQKGPRKNNVIIVRSGTSFKTLIILAKNLLKNQFNSIELHAVDDVSYLTITTVTQCLLKYNYCELTRLKTKVV